MSREASRAEGMQRLEGLPEIFPVFPLTGALLLPGGKLPLNIFESRYLAMVDDALGAGRMFGMIQPDLTLASGKNGPALYGVGCLGRVSAFSETDDGRYLITVSGLTRFYVVEEAEMRHGYRRVNGDTSRFQHDLDVVRTGDDSVAGGSINRTELLAALHRYFVATEVDANWDAIDEISDTALVITLCMACPFSAAEKQALLEAHDEATRAASLLALLDINSHRPF